MRNLFLAALVVCELARHDAPAQGQSLVLVEQGRPRSVIVTPSERERQKDASTILVETHAARCLQGHLLQMSGARLRILAEADLGRAEIQAGRIVPEQGKLDADIFILLGEGTLARRLGVSSEGLGPGGILIKTMPNALVVLGHPKISHPHGDGGGLRRAVAELLEMLGCRYLWPGESGKVVPKRATISLEPIDRRYTPAIGQRSIRFAGMSERPLLGLKRLQFTLDDWQAAHAAAMATEIDKLVGAPARGLPSSDFAWGPWHGLGGDLGIHGGHAFGDAWQKWGKDHPDWFALQADGTRDQSRAGERSRLCVSHPGLIQAIADEILQEARRQPDRKSFSICPNDGGYSSFCLCENCKRLDPPEAPKVKLLIFDKVGQSRRHEIEYPSLTDRYVYFSNEIAERVARARPDLMLLIQAYSAYSSPPVRRKLYPNLVVRYVPDNPDGWDGWRQAGARKIYWRPNILLRGYRTGELRVYGRALAETFARLARDGMLATDMDSIVHNWAVHGINYYVAARMNWNPALGYDEILNDYCAAGFGPAALPVRRYFVRAEEMIRPPKDGYTAEDTAELRRLLEAADKAAGDDEAVCRRIAFLRIGLNYTDLLYAIHRMADAADRRQPVDRAAAGRLMDLHFLVMRDILRHHHLAVNVCSATWGSGNFARWRVLGWDGQPSAGLLERIDPARHRLTGRENSIEAMAQSLGMTATAK